MRPCLLFLATMTILPGCAVLSSLQGDESHDRYVEAKQACNKSRSAQDCGAAGLYAHEAIEDQRESALLLEESCSKGNPKACSDYRVFHSASHFTAASISSECEEQNDRGACTFLASYSKRLNETEDYEFYTDLACKQFSGRSCFDAYFISKANKDMSESAEQRFKYAMSILKSDCMKSGVDSDDDEDSACQLQNRIVNACYHDPDVCLGAREVQAQLYVKRSEKRAEIERRRSQAIGAALQDLGKDANRRRERAEDLQEREKDRQVIRNATQPSPFPNTHKRTCVSQAGYVAGTVRTECSD